jgi:hypothetical protein
VFPDRRPLGVPAGWDNVDDDAALVALAVMRVARTVRRLLAVPVPGPVGPVMVRRPGRALAALVAPRRLRR